MHMNMLQLYYFKCTASHEYSSHLLHSCNKFIYILKIKQIDWLEKCMKTSIRSTRSIKLSYKW